MIPKKLYKSNWWGRLHSYDNGIWIFEIPIDKNYYLKCEGYVTTEIFRKLISEVPMFYTKKKVEIKDSYTSRPFCTMKILGAWTNEFTIPTNQPHNPTGKNTILQ
jgi:hypothetical protein